MGSYVESCESTAPASSPKPLRCGRRISTIEEAIYPYKLCATIVVAIHSLVPAGVVLPAEVLEEIARCLKVVLGRQMSDEIGTQGGDVGGAHEVPTTAYAPNTHWNSTLDKLFVDVMLEHESSWAGSIFTVPGWHSIIKRFNEVTCYSYTKIQLQYRWKNLKKDYSSYMYLRNKSGWGWDNIYNRPIPPSDNAWYEVPDRYRKYRNKPFLYFGEIQRFLVKDIATGAHAASSRPARDRSTVGDGSSRVASTQRELDFDEDLDECMPEPCDDADDSEGVAPTPVSRKRNVSGKRGSRKKSKSGGTLSVAAQEILANFLTNLPKTFAEAREDPDRLANELCRELSQMRPDLDADEFEKMAEKIATTSGRNVYYHLKGDPAKLNAWIDKTIGR